MALVLLTLIFLSTGRFLLAQPPANSPQRDLEVLRRLEEEYLRAEIEDDTAIAGTILADDYVGLKPDGSTSTKADVLSRLDRHERRRAHVEQKVFTRIEEGCRDFESGAAWAAPDKSVVREARTAKVKMRMVGPPIGTPMSHKHADPSIQRQRTRSRECGAPAQCCTAVEPARAVRLGLYHLPCRFHDSSCV